MATVTLSLPDATHAYLEAKASANGYPTVGEYLETCLVGAERAKTRDEIEAMLLEGIRSLDQESWERSDRSRMGAMEGRNPHLEGDMKRTVWSLQGRVGVI